MNKNRLYIFLIGLSFAGYAWLTWSHVGGTRFSQAPELCIFKEVTGVPCPSCGTTRSILQIIEGNLAASLAINPLGVMSALALIVLPLWIFVDMSRNTDSFYRYYRRTEEAFVQHRLLSVIGVLFVALNWFWNIAKGL